MHATPKGKMHTAMLEVGLLSKPGDSEKYEAFCKRWEEACSSDGFDVFDELCRIQTGKCLEKAEERLGHSESAFAGFVLGILTCLIVNGVKAFFFG